MVSNITSLTGKGLRDWLLQRVSSLLIGAYGLFLLAYLLCHPQLDYSQWHALFSSHIMQLLSFLVLLSVLAHAWIGIWTVTTDYLKLTGLRLFIQVLVILILLTCVVWGSSILWSI